MHARAATEERRRQRRRLAALAVGAIGALGVSGCVRSVELPERIEGVTINGQVVVRDAASGDWTGLDDVSVRVRGSTRRVLTVDGGQFKLDRLPLNVPLSLEFEAPREPDGPVRHRILDPVRGLVDGQAISLGVVQLGPTGGVRGRVLLKADENAEPVGGGGAIVTAAGTAFQAVSDAQGGFEVRGLPEGVFDFVAFNAGYRAARAEGVRVLPGSTTEIEDLVMVPGETATVTVSARAFRADVADPDAGHEGLTVTFFREVQGGEATVAARATSGADGVYQVEVSVGVYRVEISGPDLQTATLTGVAVLPEGVLGLPTVYLSALVEGDTDGDGIPDSEDDDDDNDGCKDEVDAFPKDPAFCFDNDMDGIADEIDPDDDNDGLADAEEVTAGQDGWRTNPRNEDTDGDGVRDDADLCPTVFDDQTDVNGNGVGDACEEIVTENMNPRPRIRSISPLEGGVGTVVTILGENLYTDDTPSLVQFGLPAENGRPMVPHEFGTDVLRVLVPPTAITGQLRIFAGGFAVTSTQTFTFQPSPAVFDLSPRSGRRGSQLRVVGLNFDAPDLRFFVNGEPAPIVPHPTEGDVRPIFLGNIRYEAVDVIVPNTTSGPVTVETRFGTGTSTNDFIVSDAGIVITQLVPSTIPIGSVLAVRGNGFSTADLVNPTPVEVIFNFDGARIRQPILPGSVDQQILTEVPAGAVSGRIAVDHPTLDQPVPSPGPLVIDPLIPVVTGANNEVIAIGDTLTLTGVNLTGATEVAFTGGVVVNNPSSSPGTVTLTVPAGVDPGPVTVTTPTGVSQSSFGFSILEQGPSVDLGSGGAAGGGFGQGGGEFFVVLRTREVRVLTATTSVLREDRQIDIAPLFQTGEIPVSFSIDPSGLFGVISTGRSRVQVVSIPTFAPVGACTLPARSQALSPVRFHGPSNSAYTPKANTSPTASDVGVVRIDLSTGACTEMNFGPRGPAQVQAMLVQTDELLMIDPTLGQATADIDPMSTTFGMRLQGWTQPLPEFNNVTAMVQGLGPRVLLLAGVLGVQNTFEPFAAAGATQVPGGPQRMSYALSDGISRFVVGLGLAPVAGQIIDTSGPEPRLVRTEGAPRDGELSGEFGAARAGQTAWILGDRFGRYYREVRIRAP